MNPIICTLKVFMTNEKQDQHHEKLTSDIEKFNLDILSCYRMITLASYNFKFVNKYSRRHNLITHSEKTNGIF